MFPEVTYPDNPYGVSLHPNRVLFILVRQDAKHRPKDLLTRNSHIITNVSEDGWLYEYPCLGPPDCLTAGD